MPSGAVRHGPGTSSWYLSVEASCAPEPAGLIDVADFTNDDGEATAMASTEHHWYLTSYSVCVAWARPVRGPPARGEMCE